MLVKKRATAAISSFYALFTMLAVFFVSFFMSPQPAYAATCSFGLSPVKIIVVGDSQGNNSGGVTYPTREKDYVYVGQSARWEYEIYGTGAYSNSSSSFRTSIPTGSAGTKSLSQSHTVSWTSNDGTSSCTSTVRVTGSARVIVAHDVNINYTVSPPNPTFETKTIIVTFEVTNASGSVGDLPFGWIDVTLNRGYQKGGGSAVSRIPINNGTGRLILKFTGTAQEQLNFANRAFDVMEDNGYCYGGTCVYGYDSWWQGPKSVSPQMLYQYTGQNNLELVNFRPNDPQKHKAKKGFNGQSPTAFIVAGPINDPSFNAANRNLNRRETPPSGVSLAGYSSQSGKGEFFCELLRNCGGKIGKAWTSGELAQINSCYLGDNPYTLKQCIESSKAYANIGYFEYGFSGSAWDVTGNGQKAFFLPAYNGIKYETSVANYVGPVVTAMHPGHVKVCETESVGLNWMWFDYGQAFYGDSKYDNMRLITPDWRYNLGEPFFYYSDHSGWAQVGKLNDFALTEFVPTWSNDRWDIAKPSFVNIRGASANYYGGRVNTYSPMMGRDWGGSGVTCRYPDTSAANKGKPTISFKLKLPESDGTNSLTQRVYKDTMPLTIQELSVKMGTKKMFAPNIVFKIYTNTGTYASPRKGTNVATLNATKNKAIVQQITQCHANGGNLKKNMCKDFNTTGALELPVNPTTGKGEYVIEAYWAGDCDPLLRPNMGWPYNRVSNKVDFGKCGYGGSYNRSGPDFAYQPAVSNIISFTVVKEFQCLFENSDPNKNIWITYKDEFGNSYTVKGGEVYRPYSYTKLDGTVVNVASTFTNAQRNTLSNGGTVVKSGVTYKLDAKGELAVIIVRSGEKLLLNYPAVRTSDYVGIIDTPGVNVTIRTQTALKVGSSPSEDSEVRLYPMGSDASYPKSGLLFENLLEVVAKQLPAMQDMIAFFWPSKQVFSNQGGVINDKRFSVTVTRSIEIYGWAYPPLSNVPKLDWHKCQDVPESEAVTVISSQVNQ